MSPKNKFSNLNKPCENINMLLEAISSDDDIAMDFDEDGVLVLQIDTFACYNDFKL